MLNTGLNKKIQEYIPSRGVELIRQKERNKISQEKFGQELARWTAEMIAEYRPRNYPEKPQKLKDINLIGVDLNKYVKDHPDVGKYFRDRESVRLINLSNEEWLKECYEMAHEDDRILFKNYLLKHDTHKRINNI